MDRIKQLFQNNNDNIFSVYFTAGYPKLNQTATIIRTLADSGVDLIEIGMPFSDPVADGLTIQESSSTALKNGMSISILLEQLKDIRQYTQIPLVLMGYLNPILQYGIDAFCSEVKECGIDGLIIPDLPMHEYQEEYKSVFEAHGLKIIYLITTQTDEERIRLIDDVSDGFIYLVTLSAITGGKLNFTDSQLQYLKNVQQLKLKNPVLAGFGISDRAGFNKVNEYVNGAIIGSSFIRALGQTEYSLEQSIKNFVKTIIS